MDIRKCIITYDATSRNLRQTTLAIFSHAQEAYVTARFPLSVALNESC